MGVAHIQSVKRPWSGSPNAGSLVIYPVTPIKEMSNGEEQERRFSQHVCDGKPCKYSRFVFERMREASRFCKRETKARISGFARWHVIGQVIIWLMDRFRGLLLPGSGRAISTFMQFAF